MSNLMTLSNQWATRPNDQRFLTLADLHAAVSRRRAISRPSAVTALDKLRVIPTEGGDLLLSDRDGTDHGQLTNWATDQLCKRVKVPAVFVRTLPAELAAVNLQWALEHGQGDDDDDDRTARVLTREKGRGGVNWAAAVTSGTYGRIWDDSVTGALVSRIDTNVWKIPGASYAGSDPLRATTLYASDRDVFAFLCNESNPITIPGESKPKHRGFYVRNSEVGGGVFELCNMLYDYVCDNRIIWGASNVQRIKIRHTSGAPHRFLAEAEPMLRKMLTASASVEETALRAAQAKIVGADKPSVVDWMRQRGFGLKLASRAYDACEAEAIRNPRSLWGVVSGLTEIAHTIPHTNERVALESDASALLSLV